MSLAAISARRALVAGLLTSLAAITTAAAFPHEKGSLTLARREFHAGDTLALAGGKFSPRGRLTLSLVGTGGRTVLGEVVTDSAGAFRAGLAVPAGLAPAPYRLVAVAEDGDEVASLDVVCSPPMSAEHGETHAGMAHQPGGETMMPSAEPLNLRRARSVAVTGTAVGGVVFALLLAGVLLRNKRHTG